MRNGLKSVIVVLLGALLWAPSLGVAQDYEQDQSTSTKKSSPGIFVGHEKWLACQANDQCVIVRGHACGFMFAINKNYSIEANVFASKHIVCRKPYMYPANAGTVCSHNECKMVFPSSASNTDN